MGYIIQDTFRILKEELPSTFDYYSIKDNDEEVRAFIECNMLDKSFSSIDNNYYHNVNFYDNKTGEEYRAFEEGYLYMFPKNDMLKVGHNLNAFSISRELKSIRVNENGLFVETDDRLGNIVTKYYSKESLKKIEENTLSCASIDYIEENIANLGIKPNITINAFKQGSNMTVQLFDGDNLLDRRVTTLDNPNAPAYKAYYDFMNDYKLYTDPVEYVNTNNKTR